MIHFICSAPVEYQLPGFSLYESFDLVSQGKRIARLKKNAAAYLEDFSFLFEIEKVQKVFTAPSGQTYHTGKYLFALQITPAAELCQSKLLKSTRFRMSDVISAQEFKKLGQRKALIKARRKFVEQLFDNRLPERKELLEKRIRQLLKQCVRQDQEILCIGHAFFLKILQGYLANPNIFTNRSAFVQAFEATKRPFAPLQGFSVSAKTISRVLG